MKTSAVMSNGEQKEKLSEVNLTVSEPTIIPVSPTICQSAMTCPHFPRIVSPSMLAGVVDRNSSSKPKAQVKVLYSTNVG